jgi:hypothetical protein
MIEKILDPLLAPFRFIRDKVFLAKQAPARLRGEVSRARGQVGQVQSDFQMYRADARQLQQKATGVSAKAAQARGPQAPVAAGGMSLPAGNPPARKKMGFFSSLFAKKPKCPSCNNKLHPSWIECPYCGWSVSAGPGVAAAGPPGAGAMQSAPVAPMPMAGGAQRTMALDMNAINAPAASPPSTQLIGWFIPTEGKQVGELFQIKGRTTVGKAPDCTIVIVEEPSVSGHHAEFVPTANGFRLYDLGSTNGTFVNDRRVTTHDLVDNDNVRLGRLNFKYKSVV